MPGRGDYGKREAKKPKKDSKKVPMIGGMAPIVPETEVLKSKGKKSKDW